MRFRKRLNNNVIVAIDDNGVEQVLFGRGLGFDHGDGPDVDMIRVERVYVHKQHSATLKLQQLLEMISIDYVDVAMQIFEDAHASLRVPLSDSVVVPLADHVHMAVLRARDGTDIKNMMLQEIQRFYRDEYAIGARAVALINERFDTALGDDEAGFVALHLLNAEVGGGALAVSLSKITELIHDIEVIVRMHYGAELDADSEQYRRFVTHLRFLSARLADGTSHRAEDVTRILTLVRETYPSAAECVARINDFIVSRYQKSLTQNEYLYLTIHVAHITHNPSESEPNS